MTKQAMSKTALVSGILCIGLAVIVFVSADGLRRWYSGLFFAGMGAVLLVNAIRWRGATDESQVSAGRERTP